MNDIKNPVDIIEDIWIGKFGTDEVVDKNSFDKARKSIGRRYEMKNIIEYPITLAWLWLIGVIAWLIYVWTL